MLNLSFQIGLKKSKEVLKALTKESLILLAIHLLVSCRKCQIIPTNTPKKQKRGLEHSFSIDQNHQGRERLSLGVLTSWTMELSIMASGLKRALEKAKVSNFGKMVASMKDIGKTTRLMGMEDSYMQMVIATTEIG